MGVVTVEQPRRGSAIEGERERLQLKDDFLAAAAHDLRAPLTVILGRAQMLRRRAAHDPGLTPLVGDIDSVIASSLHMKRLIDGLLTCVREDQAGFVTSAAPVDLLLLAQEAARRFGAWAPRIIVAGESTIAPVDRDRFEQAISNLLDNALKYSDDRAPVYIGVGTERESAYVAVSDRGDGISDVDLPWIFERFQRGSGTREQHAPGSGLGLHICKRIVEEHGGTIAVSSASGAGSTFRVTVPLRS